ncbi:MAG TPA: ABC transporter permease, partial [Gemmatimonadaceae bacterium]
MTWRWSARRGARDGSLDEEIRAHLDMATADRIARGERPDAAAAAVRREFGNVTHVKEVTREMWGGLAFERLVQDARYAMRSLARAPGFTIVAVVTLALGIGVNTAMFTVVNGVLIRPLPFHEPGRLVLASYAPPRGTFMRDPGMYDRSFLDLRSRATPFEGMTTFNSRLMTLTGRGDPARLTTALVTPDFFATLGTPAAHGRTFAAGEDQAGNDNVVVLSDEVWRSRFDGDPHVVGTTVTIDDTPRTVVGVMPPAFDFPYGARLWVPLRIEIDPGNTMARPVVARLARGVSEERAASIFTTMAAHLALLPNQKRNELKAELLPVKTLVVDSVERPLIVLTGAVVLVLLLACTNVANLLLMRAASRDREIALRTALGASRPRLIRQLLTESTVLGVAGGVCGLVVAWWGVRAVVALAPAGKVPRVEQIVLDTRVLGVTLVVSLLTGIAFGIVPAFVATRQPLREALASGRRTTAASHGWLRGTLVVSEISLALVLLVGAGLMIRSFQRMRSVDLGFRSAGVVTAQVVLNEGKYRTAVAMHDFDRRSLEALSHIPGVTAAGAVNYRPMGGALTAGDFVIDREPPLPPNRWADKLVVGGDYFAAMGIQVRRGRAFTPHDDEHAPRVIIVSQSVARRFWPNENPIGKRVSYVDRPTSSDWMTIVGVVDDVVQRGVTTSPDPALYLPFAQVTQTFFLADMSFALRTTSALDDVARSMRRTIAEIDPTMAVPLITTMDDHVISTIGDSIFQTRLLSAFSLMAVLLAAVGIYGLLAFAVSERGHEIGVRMALGATSRDVVSMVGRNTLGLVIPGLALGTL